MTNHKGVDLLTSKNKIKGIQDDQFFHIGDELEAIRLHLGMYVAEQGTGGALHLCKEILNNSIDECNNDNDHWKHNKKSILIEFYESKRKFIVNDNGRGIPLDILKDVIMQKHTSTKTIGLSNIRNKKQTGLNGVGLTVTAALTDYMSLTSFRGNEKMTIELIDGVPKEYPPEKMNKYDTGTRTEIIPSEKYLGHIELTNDIIEDYIRNISYILADDIDISLQIENPAKKGAYILRNYKAQGLDSAIKYMSSSLEFQPITLKSTNDRFDITISFSYDKTLDDMSITSFCNYIITTEGGCHETAATKALCEYFSKEARRQDPNSKYEVSYDDCRKGLVLAVNLEHVEPKFEGQHKTRVSNNEIINEGKRALITELFQYMNNNPLVLKKIIAYLRTISKARQEAHKIKGVTVKKNTTFLEDAKIDKYFTVSNRNSSGYKELFLCEGDSASGAILNSRNPSYQAVYTVQGVTDNVHDLSLTQLLQKSMFRELIQILGTGIGKDFDINKLRYNKIIICTDADADGSNITSLLLCFFFIFTPELITQGKIFKAMPPLYLMDLKSLRKFYNGREWLYSKTEYYNMINSVIVNNCEFKLEVNNKNRNRKPTFIELSKKEAKDWLNMNAEYKLELDNLGKKSACDTRVVEKVCFLKKQCSSKNEFKHLIEKEYPEMNYNPKLSSSIGSSNGEFFSLICDELFDRSASRFLNELNKNKYYYVWYRINGNEKFTRATIGEFLTDMYSIFNIKIDQRYKGLGEADAELLFRTTTNPKFRKLLQITLNDIDKTKEVFELLHGKSNKLREARRELIDNTHLSYADIDN